MASSQLGKTMDSGGQSLISTGVNGKPSLQKGAAAKQIFQPRSATEASDLQEMLVHSANVFLLGPVPL